MQLLRCEITRSLFVNQSVVWLSYCLCC